MARTLMLNAALTRASLLPDNVRHTSGWFICPRCAWVSRVVVRGACPGAEIACPCPRPSDAYLFNFVLGDKTSCGRAVSLSELAPRVADALEAALRLHGTNACIKLLDGLTKIDVGIDDPGGVVPASSVAKLEELRPGSVAPLRKKRR